MTEKASALAEELPKMAPVFVHVFSKHEHKLTHYIQLMDELDGLIDSNNLAEGRALIEQGCEIVRQAIERAGSQEAASS